MREGGEGQDVVIFRKPVKDISLSFFSKETPMILVKISASRF